MTRLIHGIRFKTVVLMLVITLVPTLIITGWLYRKAARMMIQEAQYNQAMSIESMANYMEGVLDDVDIIASNILTDSELSALVTAPSGQRSAYENYQSVTRIRAKLDGLKNVNENIDSIYLYDEKNGRIFSTDFYGYIDPQKTPDGTAARVRALTQSDSQWNVEEDWNGKALLCNRKRKAEKGEEAFSFLINLDQRKVNRLLEEMKGNPDAAYCILDGEGREIASTGEIPGGLMGEKPPAYSGTFELSAQGEDYYAVAKDMDEVAWKFISVIPSRIVLGKLDGIRSSMVLIYLITAALILLFGLYMNRLIYSPIRRLIAAMQMNRDGTLTTCDVDAQKDEFGEIAKNFNELILAQDALNKRLRQQEVLTKNAEIRFLQAQINPHFLYNVLDTIHWMAGMGKNKEVMQMTFALSRFYRSSLIHGDEMVAVSEALSLAQAYFDIQKIRFCGGLELIVDIEEEVQEAAVPKRLFQPILENAIQHGMADKNGKGVILLSGVRAGKDIKFVIEDNGKGMSREKAEAVNRAVAGGDFETPGNYALKNLNSQLRLIYGEAYGLHLESREGRGTAVTVRIAGSGPKRGGEARECTD